MFGRGGQLPLLAAAAAGLPAGQHRVLQGGAAGVRVGDGGQIKARLGQAAEGVVQRIAGHQHQLVGVGQARGGDRVEGVEGAAGEARGEPGFAGHEAQEHIGDHGPRGHRRNVAGAGFGLDARAEKARQVVVGGAAQAVTAVRGQAGVPPALQAQAGRAADLDEAAEAVDGHAGGDPDLLGAVGGQVFGGMADGQPGQGAAT